jgi:Ni,Fe-hydrogenase maturation factor
MSPEDMSKSLALQTLAKFGDFYSVNIFEVLKIKFENHATLKSIAEACAEQVKKDKFVSKISKQLEEEFDFNDSLGPATEREAKHQRKDINKFAEDLRKFYEGHRD